MVFNSFAFLLFFSVFYFIYWWVSKRYSVRTRNIIIILASYVFYGYWDARFLGLIVASSLLDFFIAKRLHVVNDASKRKLLLFISVLFNLGLLGFFKYFNFFIESAKFLFEGFGLNLNTDTLEIILPVGISFYTFQTLSYTIDVYRNKISPEKHLDQFLAFVSFFPQLVAGPIERANTLLPQFSQRKLFKRDTAVVGLRLMLWGFFKKVCIADNVGVLVNCIFNPELEIGWVFVIVGAALFGIQIYCDFSGYSDIAIGIAKTLGFDLRTNFSTPYFARTLSEFWSRWHISLSTWFRDYVYIPLGGNRDSSRVYLNIIFTFMISGLWHGASWNFIWWGLAHGIALVIEKHVRIQLPRLISTLLTLFIVVLLWLPFRISDLSQLSDLVYGVFSLQQSEGTFWSLALDLLAGKLYWILPLLIFFFALESQFKQRNFSEWLMNMPRIGRLFMYYFLVFMILILGNFSVKPDFIYFQF